MTPLLQAILDLVPEDRTVERAAIQAAYAAGFADGTAEALTTTTTTPVDPREPDPRD